MPLGKALAIVSLILAGIALTLPGRLLADSPQGIDAQEGHASPDPDIPSLSEVTSATTEAALAALLEKDHGMRCLNLDLGQINSRFEHADGIGVRATFYTLTLPTEVSVGDDQTARDTLIAQLDYLADLGFFEERRTSIAIRSTPKSARQYSLTWKGFAQSTSNFVRPCFFLGTADIGALEAIKTLPAKVGHQPEYQVTFQVVVRNVPSWATTKKARATFPELASLTDSSIGTVDVAFDGSKWRPAVEVRSTTDDHNSAGFVLNRKPQDLIQSTSGNQTARDFILNRALQDLRPILNTPAPDDKAVGVAIAQYLANAKTAPWAVLDTCLPFFLLRGGDTDSDRNTISPYAFTYFDLSQRKYYEWDNLLNALQLLVAMQQAGIATMKKVSDEGAVPRPEVRFEVDAEAVRVLKININNGCFPIGKLNVEVVGVLPFSRGGALIRARAITNSVPALTKSVAKSVPALQTVLDKGLPIQGQITLHVSKADGSQTWGAMLGPEYPQMIYSELPVEIAPLLPITSQHFRFSDQTLAGAPWQSPLTTRIANIHGLPDSDNAKLAKMLSTQLDSIEFPFLYEYARRVVDSDPDQAIISFWRAGIRGRYDLFRCSDETARQALLFITPIAGNVIELMKSEPYKSRLPDLALRAVSIEEKAVTAYLPDKSLCGHGIANVVASVSGHEVESWYVPEEKWNSIHRDILDHARIEFSQLSK